MNNTKNLFVTQNEKLLCIKGTEHLFSVCHKTNDFVTETVAENIEEKEAYLFAAAPYLLSAARNAANILAALATGQLAAIHPDSNALQELRVAIAKAKGEA